MDCVVKAKSGKVETVEEEPLPEVTEESVGSLTDDVCSAPVLFEMTGVLLLLTDCPLLR